MHYLRDTVLVFNHNHNVIQGQETVTFYFSGGILSLGAARQQLHQFYVIPERQLCTSVFGHIKLGGKPSHLAIYLSKLHV